MNKNTLPRITLARKMAANLYETEPQAIIEIMDYDGVDEVEARRRYDIALAQKTKRALGQYRRKSKQEDMYYRAQGMVFAIAHKRIFRVPEDLIDISATAGFGAMIGVQSTGKAFVEFVLRQCTAGMLDEIRNEDDRLIGYRLSARGTEKYLAGEI